MDAKEARFTQKELAQNVVKIRVGQQDAVNRSIARAALGRVQTGKGLDLLPKVRRGIDQKPSRAIRADGHARLGTGGYEPPSCQEAIMARAIPLRHTAASGCS